MGKANEKGICILRWPSNIVEARRVERTARIRSLFVYVNGKFAKSVVIYGGKFAKAYSVSAVSEISPEAPGTFCQMTSLAQARVVDSRLSGPGQMMKNRVAHSTTESDVVKASESLATSAREGSPPHRALSADCHCLLIVPASSILSSRRPNALSGPPIMP